MNLDLWHWFGVVGFFALSFFLSGMEAGAHALSRLQIRRLVRQGNQDAKRLLKYLDSPENFLWTILVGNTLANFAVAALLLFDLHAWFPDQPWFVWPSFLLVIAGIYIFAELLPKTLYQRFPNRLSLRSVGLFRMVHFCLSPIVALAGRVAAVLLWMTGGTAMSGNLVRNRKEFRAIMQESGAALSTTEKRLINRVLDLQSLTLRNVGVPLSRTDSVEVSTPVEDVLRLCRDREHTRLPVWDGAGKNRRIIGVVNLRHILYNDPNPAKKFARDFLHPALVLDESMGLEEALRQLQRSGDHLAIVVGPDGREHGLVSLADILRLIFGEVSL
ncbi:MAG TPA: CNNM domain-containing protein [Candidatus Limnocylindria bacterium]|nr:CNNM domain-containing protein [Candidatus Limnocylindria bacterium]